MNEHHKFFKPETTRSWSSLCVSTHFRRKSSKFAKAPFWREAKPIKQGLLQPLHRFVNNALQWTSLAKRSRRVGPCLFFLFLLGLKPSSRKSSPWLFDSSSLSSFTGCQAEGTLGPPPFGSSSSDSAVRGGSGGILQHKPIQLKHHPLLLVPQMEWKNCSSAV